MQHDAPPLHEMSHIETPEQIALQFPLAGIPSRAFAYMIDFFAQLVPLIAALVASIAFVPGIYAGKTFAEKSPDGQLSFTLLAQALAALAVFFTNFGYFLFFEIFWRGQTPGKRLMGIRVMRDGGYPIEARASLIRNLLRAIDFLPAFYLVGMAAAFWGRTGKRLGDYAAGTVVIKESSENDRDEALANTAGSGTAPVVGTLLLPAERVLVRDFLTRAPALDEASAHRIADIIARKIAARLGAGVPADPQAYLSEVYRRGNV